MKPITVRAGAIDLFRIVRGVSICLQA